MASCNSSWPGSPHCLGGRANASQRPRSLQLRSCSSSSPRNKGRVEASNVLGSELGGLAPSLALICPAAGRWEGPVHRVGAALLRVPTCQAVWQYPVPGRLGSEERWQCLVGNSCMCSSGGIRTEPQPQLNTFLGTELSRDLQGGAGDRGTLSHMGSVSWGGRYDPREMVVRRALADPWMAGSLSAVGPTHTEALERAFLGHGRHQETGTGASPALKTGLIPSSWSNAGHN